MAAMDEQFTRRNTLLRFGGLIAAGLGVDALRAGDCPGDTGQVYVPDSLTDKVCRRAPYHKRPNRSTRNSNDFVFANGGMNSMLTVRSDGSGGYVAAITIGVMRS